MTRLQYNVVCQWNHRKSIRNFWNVYRYCFNYRFLLWRPCWRIWRIFRNTVLTDKYFEIERKFANEFQFAEHTVKRKTQ